jgi:hypothetical protein
MRPTHGCVARSAQGLRVTGRGGAWHRRRRHIDPPRKRTRALPPLLPRLVPIPDGAANHAGASMPLTHPPVERELMHLRDIALRGYRRSDGLFDIEAHLVDTKTPLEANRSGRQEAPPGTPIHGMWLRLTVSEDMVVVACEASSDFTPYAICPQAAPNFARLAGLKIGPGFNRAVAERVGGTHGCTHLRELLGQMATVVYQTLYPYRARKEREEAERRAAAGEHHHGAASRKKPALVGTCIAYAPDSPVTLGRWPWLKDVPPAAE